MPGRGRGKGRTPGWTLPVVDTPGRHAPNSCLPGIGRTPTCVSLTDSANSEAPCVHCTDGDTEACGHELICLGSRGKYKRRIWSPRLSISFLCVPPLPTLRPGTTSCFPGVSAGVKKGLHHVGHLGTTVSKALWSEAGHGGHPLPVTGPRSASNGIDGGGCSTGEGGPGHLPPSPPSWGLGLSQG